MSRRPYATHEVVNQATPLVGYNVFDTDAALVEGVRRYGSDADIEMLRQVGSRAGSGEVIEWGFRANTNLPVLHTHDRFGNRLDEVVYDPSWHSLMGEGIGYGMAAQPPEQGAPGAHVKRGAMLYMWSRAEAGCGCPMSMTYAAVRALRWEPELAAKWEPLLTSREYEPGLAPPEGKRGVLSGMALTEKQGGSDLRANSTVAEPTSEGEWLLTGHKWFCSAPMCDTFLVLARAPGGLSLFYMPRVLSDGSHNGFLIQRLKDKMGNKANASSEIELDQALAWPVGEEGRGVRTVVEMIGSCRFDALASSSALMREALTQAIWHTSGRMAFGRVLLDQPLMRNVLADIALEVEGATALFLRLAASADREGADEKEHLLRRIGVAVGKFYVTKRAPTVVAEAMEVLGGNGYVEESVLPRLYREAPVNSIWEGSGSVNALDVLRAIRKEPEVFEAYLEEVGTAVGANSYFDEALAKLKSDLGAGQPGDELEWSVRSLSTRMAVLLEASLLLRDAPGEVAGAFCASRLGTAGVDPAALVLGTLPPGTDTRLILDRAMPRV